MEEKTKDSSISDYLKDIDAQKLLVPALAAGALGGGALALSSPRRRRDETPEEARNRKLKTVALGAGVGSLAGAAIPGGLKLLQTPPDSAVSNRGTLNRSLSALGTAGIGNLGSIAGGGGALLLGHRMNVIGRRKAGEQLASILKNTYGIKKDQLNNILAPLADHKNVFTTRQRLKHDLNKIIDATSKDEGVTYMKKTRMEGRHLRLLRRLEPRFAKSMIDKNVEPGPARVQAIRDIYGHGSWKKLRGSMKSRLFEGLARRIDSLSTMKYMPHSIKARPLGTQSIRLLDRVSGGSLRRSLGRAGLLGAGLYAGGQLHNALTGD